MTDINKVTILHFSDVLCIWAYLSQIRIDELKKKFGNKIELKYHFIQVFGSVKPKIEQDWNHKGGFTAYSQHVLEAASKFEHVEVHPKIWTRNIPVSCASCHLFLKAIQLCEEHDQPLDDLVSEGDRRSLFEKAVWELRLAFFRDLVNISKLKAQMEIAERLDLPIQKIRDQIESGAAFAALDLDMQLKERHRVIGSPTLVFNEGRQILYGNVGYRIIEANIQELLRNKEGQASWC
ncbi:MAG: DsbA family protein [Thermodesulfobacteriota bacterium]|nr:DsbA family protein [Thermodesulfobacteriota bacterium]